MVYWQFCTCGRVVDEYESQCHWCGLGPKQEGDDEESHSDLEEKDNLN